MKTLAAGDHYLSVLWDGGATERPPFDSLKLLGTSLLVTVAGLALLTAGIYISERYGIHWPGGSSHDPVTRRSLPVWIQRTVLWLIVAGYLYYIVLPWVIKRPAPSLAGLVLKLIRRKSRSQAG